MSSVKGVTQTLKALMYGATPNCLLGWIPIAGVFTVLWTLILQIVGIRQLHELSTKRAVLAVIFGMVLAIKAIIISAMPSQICSR